MTAGTTMFPAAGGARRYLSLSLPRLPTDRLERRMSPDARGEPRATVVAEKGALSLCALNAAAEALGLSPGLALADARARHPVLAVSEAAPEDDARVLARFADACERYTPLLALDGAEGLLLDVTGCAHLFGGEAGLVRDLLRRVAAQGFAARAALAATAGAAFALARFSARGERRCGAGVVVPAEEELAPLMAPLPLAALRLDAETVGALARLGFRRVGELLDKPRPPLAARFGAGLLHRLDAVLGRAGAAVDYRFAPPVFCAERNLFEPVERTDDVLGLTAHLAATLAPALERHGVGARRLDLVLFRVDGKVTRLAIGTGRPLRDPEAIRRLFAEKLKAVDTLDAGFGFDLLRLAVRETGPIEDRQTGFASEEDGAAALDGLIDRLSIRFGARQVQALLIEDRHWPDTACRAVPAQGVGGAALLAGAQEVEGAGLGMAEAACAEDAGAGGDDRVAAVPLAGPDRLRTALHPVSFPAVPPPNSPPQAGEGFGRPMTGGAAPEAPPPARFPSVVPAAAAGRDPSPSPACGGGRRRGRAGEDRKGVPVDLAARPDLCGPDRPLRLLERPEPVEAVAEVPDGPPIRFRWRRRLHQVARAEGPERIAAEWWRQKAPPERQVGGRPDDRAENPLGDQAGNPMSGRADGRMGAHAGHPAGDHAGLLTRDYFRVETREGHRFWLFRAGLYGRETARPRWFLHGLFG